MKVLLLAAAIAFLAGGTCIGLAQDARNSPETFFELKIRPVLAAKCSKCHGSEKAGNNLRLDSRDAILKGGDSGPAVVPGEPGKSLIITAIRQTGDLKMPPDGKVSDDVVADFVRWIKKGAVWPAPAPGASDPFLQQRHWAFQPLADVSPPEDSQGRAENDVDRFIIAKLREMNLKPTSQAEKRTLLRRACFDLIGLPPTPEQMNAFLNDESPSAFERVVDDLLASPRYGERWGRHWMDVVHYCDSGGDNADYPVPELHLYRDYIIDSFNADKPFNQFVREQVAGDILAKSGAEEKYAEQVIATGFLALARSYGTLPNQHPHLRIEDTLETFGYAFLGLTLRCARCHDHKFDPVTTRDYYSLYAIFASTNYPWAGSSAFVSANTPRLGFVPLLPPAQAAPRMDAYQHEIRRLESELKQAESEKKPKEELDRLRKELRSLKRPGLAADLPGAYAVSDGPPANTHIQLRGDPVALGPRVYAAVPAFLAPTEAIRFPEDGSGRLQLADWLVEESNPLTARVIVNRIWQHHFGRGIVSTPSNFGISGEAPTHPELLDWLTRRFMEDGWSIKKLHRLMMLSKTYRLSSETDAGNAAVDPDNRYCWKFERHRLDAEAMRDSMLFVSGQMDLSRPGPHPFPPIETWEWTMNLPFREVYPSMHRSVYLMTQRIQRHPYLELFDGADTSTSTARRTESNVPLQSLFLINSPFVEESAGALAGRLSSAENGIRGRIRLAHEWAYSRLPTEHEYATGRDYILQYFGELKQSGVQGDAASHAAWTSYARIILAANEFRYID